MFSGESKHLFDIKFENGELKIPCLVLYDRTESFFRNVIAFEECYYPYKSEGNLLSYMFFIDQLVNTPADTRLLIDNGIIENWLSNEEAATDLINAFCKETTLGDNKYYFNSLSQQLVKHCYKPYNKWEELYNGWMATLKHDYCGNPWVITSVIGAVVLLLLTVVQTVCSILSVA